MKAIDEKKIGSNINKDLLEFSMAKKRKEADRNITESCVPKSCFERFKERRRK